jgi:hypothetical protein
MFARCRPHAIGEQPNREPAACYQRDERRDRLLAAGFIREVVDHLGRVSALVLTGAGIRRLEAGK